MKRVRLVLQLMVSTLLFGCSAVMPVAPQPDNIESVAVVSLALEVEDAALSGRYGLAENALQENTDALLSMTETELSGQWRVVPAWTFVGQEGYLELSRETLEGVVAARSGNRTLGIFVESAQELRKARLEPETARELCMASGADAVLVIHCAWSVKATGGAAQARPSSRVTVSLWGADGTQSFVRRVDKQGEVSAGRGDLAPWFESYRQALRLALD